LTLPALSGTVLTTGSSGQSIPKAALPTGSVLQVVSTFKSDTFSTSSTTFVDVTGYSVSITPTSATSKILVIAYLSGQGSPAVSVTQQRLMRGTTAIAIGDASGSRTPSSSTLYTSVPDNIQQATITYLDSPATTSSTTYKCQMRVNSGTGYINRTSNDSDGSDKARTISTITVMEIAA
jgi:hypothetical protein